MSSRSRILGSLGVLTVASAIAVPAASLAQSNKHHKHKTSSHGVAGPRGPKGDKGDTGLQGPTGPTGAAGVNGTAGRNAATTVVVRWTTQDVGAGGLGNPVASCLPGEVATGGGGHTTNYVTFPITGSYPLGPGGANVPQGGVATEWTVSGVNNGGSTGTVEAFVLCASP